MKGKYRLQVRLNKIYYDLTVQQKITVVDDNSGTGKTKLFDCAIYGTIKCSIPVITAQLLRRQKVGALAEIKAAKDCILIIDDPDHIINEHEYLTAINNADCYFILLSHDNVQSYTYAVSEIYQVWFDGTTNRFKHRYKPIEKVGPKIERNPVVVTEDSRTGFDMVKSKYPNVVSARGRDNVINTLQEAPALYIVDGAAFGANVKRVLCELQDKGYPAVLYMSVSFEYDILAYTSVRKMLSNTDEMDAVTYCDFGVYLTYEQYFTDLLKKVALGYNKHNLTQYLNNALVQTQYLQHIEAATEIVLLGNTLTEAQLEGLRLEYPIAYSVYVSSGDVSDVQLMIEDIKKRY